MEGNGSDSESSCVTNHEVKLPCDTCGCNANYDKIMTCFHCREAREHIYCAKVVFQSVPPMWICEECRTSSGVLLIEPHVARDSNDSADSGRPNHAFAIKTSPVDGQNSGSQHPGNETLATNQPSQSQAHTTTPEASSSVPNDASDSESAI